jgi:hypothetical protein
MSEQPEELSQVTYEQLAAIEDEFEDIDTQISKSLPSYKSSTHQISRLTPLSSQSSNNTSSPSPPTKSAPPS